MKKHSCEAELERLYGRTFPGAHQAQARDGELWCCPCGKLYEHVCDEAEGCSWSLTTDRHGELVKNLRANRFRFSNEAELQAGIRLAIDKAFPAAAKAEVNLDARSRIDFLVGSMGIECKVDGSTVEVIRQLHRYAQSTQISSLVLVTNRSRHLSVPREISNKPVSVVFTAEAL